MAWLLLVTAVETAAHHWRKATVSPMSWLRERKPKLRDLFKKEGRDDLLDAVARELANLVGATAQFRGFLEAFCPNAPAERPQECYQHSWERKDLRKSFGAIYSRRSDFVHSGIAFPAMMCQRPYQDEQDKKRYAEKPMGSAMATQGASWKQEDAPMQLHIFEHIVRGALLEWWKWCLPGIPCLNLATQEELESIPGIGHARAATILQHRTSKGDLKHVSELNHIKGIGKSTVALLSTHTTLVKKSQLGKG